MVAILLAVTVPAMSFAQDTTLNAKTEKAYKKKLAELEREGWEIFGSSSTLQDALLAHYKKLSQRGKNAIEILGRASVTDPRHKNLLMQNALTNACNTYAKRFNNARGPMIEKEINGGLKPSFAVIKEDGDSHTDMMVFCIAENTERRKGK